MVNSSGDETNAFQNFSSVSEIVSREIGRNAAIAVARGELLLTLEAMKMQTAVRAESDGEVAEVLARPGQTVDAKDLLVVLR